MFEDYDDARRDFNEARSILGLKNFRMRAKHETHPAELDLESHRGAKNP